MHYHRWYRHGDYNISPNWNNLKKGIPHKNASGYLRINTNGNRILYHRHLMEKYLGRRLKPFPQEIVHHINGIKTDNRLSNLELKSQSRHIKENHKKQKYVNWDNYNVPTKMTKKRKFCLVRECHRKPRVRDLCQKHYLSYYRTFT